MIERYTPALTLRKEHKNEKDILYILYTKELGKIMAVAKSARRITSKVAGHLTLGRIAGVRVIDKGSFQLLDALSDSGQCEHPEIIRFLRFLDDMTPYDQPDLHIWHVAAEVIRRCRITPIVYRELLSIMGFAPPRPLALPVCARCKKDQPPIAAFYIPDLVFLCSNCSTDDRIDKNDLVQVI